MRKRRSVSSTILGLAMGLALGFTIMGYRRITINLEHETSQDQSESYNVENNADSWTLYNSDLSGRHLESLSSLLKRSNATKKSDSSDDLLFVGVMTARKYLKSRAKAVYETWGKQVPGGIAFFSSEGSKVPDNCPDLPLVALPGIDDNYPPQKKSFMMLQYMWQNFGDRFQWFLRADDDVYVRTDRLETLLRSIDSRKPMYIGQAGRGNTEEIGLLSLDYDENFCMGGPGVILSRETLKRIVPHIKYCLRHLYTNHEDVEVGRCVRKFAGIPCTWSYEMQSIFYHNSSGDRAFTDNLKTKEIHRAITLHPVKNPPHMYRMHNYMMGLRIQDLQQEKINLHRDIYSMGKELGMSVENLKNYQLAEGVPLFPVDRYSEQYPGDTEILGVPAGLRIIKPLTSEEVIPWDFISKSEYSLNDPNPRRRIHSDVKEGLQDITREVMSFINAYSRQRGRIVEEKSTLYGYRRVNSYGADTILDLLLIYKKYRGKKVTLPVRRHVYLHQHFTGLEIREMINDHEVINFNEQDPTPDKIIHFILPLSGRYKAFQRFLQNYENVCLKRDEKAELIVILYPHKFENSYGDAIDLLERLKHRYANARIKVISGDGNFSRASALHLGVSQVENDALMFFIDVDIAFAESALYRIRYNTLLGKQIYFPIVFSQYNPNIVHDQPDEYDLFDISDGSGYWRQYGFGIVSVYKQDYRTVGGFNLSIQGWGKEDVEFYDATVKSDLEIFRVIDKDLVHVYHDVDCGGLQGIQLSMCVGTKFNTYAGTEKLAKIIHENSDLLRFAKGRRERLSNGSN